MRMHTADVPGACGGQKEEPDLVELEPQVAVSHHAGAGNKHAGPLFLQPLSCLSSPLLVHSYIVFLWETGMCLKLKVHFSALFLKTFT